MLDIDPSFLRLAIALGIGLLIGIERERSHATDGTPGAAGARTFTLTALVGAISLLVGGEWSFIAFGLVIGALIVVGYRHTHVHDPGMTTEVAQIAVFMLGGLAMHRPQFAAGVGVAIAILLVARTRLHNWARHVLTGAEIRDGLLLLAAALIILPLTPSRAIDPWHVINPRQLWTLAVIVMSINGVGYVAMRTLGTRVGLPLAGFFSGFVSSTATIGAMGSRAVRQPELLAGAIAGAAIASVSSLLQLAVVIGLVDMPLLRTLALPLLAASVMAAIYAGLFTLRGARSSGGHEAPSGRPFDPKAAFIFVLVIGVALVISALLTQALGSAGLVLASAASGLGDVHATGISAASLSANQSVTTHTAALAVLTGLTANAISKTFVAFSLGGRRYGLELLPGIVLSVAAAWAALVGQYLFD
jgi:uncharacterized membrane protein (DUF4010 family)